MQANGNPLWGLGINTNKTLLKGENYTPLNSLWLNGNSGIILLVSGCESDGYKIGYDPIHIRFRSASLQHTTVCVYTERIDNFLRARSMVSCEKRLFSLFSQSSKTFVILCPVTMQSDPNVFGIPSLAIRRQTSICPSCESLRKPSH